MTTPVIAGKYHLLRQLGAGGMAEVYLAKQTGLDGFEKLVVVKRILPNLASNTEFTTMFLDEARTAADLRHPNVVNIFEVGEDGGTYYMAMEFLHGQDIRGVQRRVAKAEGMITIPHACQIVLDAAAGLHYAHIKQDLRGNPLNIVHRDVSPQNILVTYSGTTKIVDFGIAKAASQDTHTATGVIKGKYTYMSPEQARGDVIDARSDQYALGIVFWELLTMRRLFKRETVVKTLNAITEGEVPSPRIYVPEIPSHLEHIVMQCLAREPEDRFDSCEELTLELEDFLAGHGLVHSPARLGAYLRTLFADTLAEEAARGVDAEDENLRAQLAASSQAGPEVTRRGRRGTGKSSSRGEPVAPRARTGASNPFAETAALPAGGIPPLPSAAADEEEERTYATGEAPGVDPTILGEAPVPPLPSLPSFASLASDAGALPREADVGRAATARLPVSRGEPPALPLSLPPTPAPRGGISGWVAGGIGLLAAGGVVSGAFWALAPDDEPAPSAAAPPGVSAPPAAPTAHERETAAPSAAAGPGVASSPAGSSVLAATPAAVSPAAVSPAAAPPSGTAASPSSGAPPASPAAAPPTRDAPPAVNLASAAAGEGASPAEGNANVRDTRRSKSASRSRKAPKVDSRTGAEDRPARLRVVIHPWGEVWVDGKKRGDTPMKALTLSPGAHVIRLRNPELGIDVTENIDLKPGADILIKKSW